MNIFKASLPWQVFVRDLSCAALILPATSLCALAQQTTEMPGPASQGSSGVQAKHDPATDKPAIDNIAIENPFKLPQLTVAEAGSGSLSIKSAGEAKAALDQVAGAVSLVDDSVFRRGLTADLADVLSGVPGLFARSRFGGDEVRLSIRGSGITQTFGIRGVRVLRDGFPETEASGFTNPELIDFLAADYVEVYRGANALQYGSATLGGAINFVSKTGYTAEPFLLRVEGGSDGYVRPQLSAGTVFDNGLDGFVSVSGIHSDGFRDNAEQETIRGYANLGYRHGDGETRLHLTLQDNHLELPGPLRLEQVLDEPTQANGFWARNGAERDFQRYRVALQHDHLVWGGKLSVAAWYEDQDLDHPLPFVVIDDEDQHYGASIRHELSLDSGARWVWGVLTAFEEVDGRQFAPAGGGRKGDLRQISDAEAYNLEAYTELSYPLAEAWQAVLGAQGVIARRDAFIERSNGVITDDANTYHALNPKLGLIYQAAPELQFFSNFSLSYEPPSLVDFRNENDPDPQARSTLRGQRAYSFEIGSRGQIAEHWQWDVALYRAWLDREILQQETSPGSGQSFTRNAAESRHSGLEFGLQGVTEISEAAGYLSSLFSYTYNRFRFNQDSQFNDNRLAGIPEHIAHLELTYQHPSGFYIGPIVDVSSGSWVDFANTLRSPNYTLFGARVGYRSEQGWRINVEARNLEDQAYVSNTSVTANAAGRDGTFFNPGLDRAFFASFEWQL